MWLTIIRLDDVATKNFVDRLSFWLEHGAPVSASDVQRLARQAERPMSPVERTGYSRRNWDMSTWAKDRIGLQGSTGDGATHP